MQMITCTSARAPGKAYNSPFPELFALRRIVSRQMCVKRFKAVGMPYDDASPIASLPAKTTVPEAVAWTGAASSTAISIPE